MTGLSGRSVQNSTGAEEKVFLGEMELLNLEGLH